MIKNKKSQITVFIIIGVVLLFSTALVLYIKSQVSVPTRPVQVALERVPTELQPVQQFVTGCLEQVSMDALNLIGAHGGYISVDSNEYSGFNFEKNDEHPTEADVVSFPPGTGNYVPYWEYMKKPDSCDVCYLSSWRPPLYRTEGANSIENQVDKYVENNLRACLGNFAEFRNEGYSISEADGIKATTFVRENDVLVSLNYSLDVSKGEGEITRMALYQAAVPVKLKKLYDLAKYITDKSSETRFLGVVTLNLIAEFSRVDSSALPPFDSMKFTYDTVTWSKKNVMLLLKDMLSSYVQAVQVEGSGNFNSPERFDDPIVKGLYSGMVLGGNEVTDITANFMYLGWPIYLDFPGSKSDTLKPSRMEIPVLNILPVSEYKFAYDLSYPVVVRLSDPGAYSGKGYMFSFAMEANIRNNEPLGNVTLSIPALEVATPSTSAFCKQEQRSAGPITVRTYDAGTGLPLEGVNVIFRGSQQCSVGITEISEDALSADYGTAVLQEMFPVGIGTLILSKPGYQTDYVTFATSVDKEQRVSFSLTPLKTFTANARKKGVESNSFFPTGILGNGQNLSDYDIVIVSIEKIKELPEEDLVASALAFGAGTNGTVSNLTLVPGTYKVSVTLIYNNTVTIPEEKVCHGGVFGVGEECEELPELKLKAFTFPSVDFEWEVASDELEGKSAVNFFALYSDLPKSYEDMQEMSDKFRAFKNNMNYNQYTPVLK